MFDLSLSVICSTLIFVIFKLYNRFGIQTLYAIITNYIVASVTGILCHPNPIELTSIPKTSWFWGATILGVVFILVFRIMAKSSQENGVGVTSVATKMSLVVPVIFSLVLYKENLSIQQSLGVVLALIAVYFASLKKHGRSIDISALWLPALVFLGSGAIDTAINYFKETHLVPSEFTIFSSTVFATAAIAGIVFVGAQTLLRPVNIRAKDIFGGIALGVPNFFSIFFLLRALKSETLNSASVFTINNVAIVLFSTLVGIVLFRERLSTKNWLGIALAIISISLVALF